MDDRCTPAWIDETLHELTTHGSETFPFQYYDCFYGGNEVRFPWHWHREMEIVTVRGGEIHCLIGGERLVLAQGDGLWIQSGVIHSYEVPRRADMPTLLFLPEFIAPEHSALYNRFVAPLMDAGLSHMVLRRGVPWQGETLAAVAALCALAREKPPTLALDAHAAVCRIWALLYAHRGEIAAFASADGATLTQARLHRMIRYLEEHFTEKVRLPDVARAASVSVSEALRCFRAGVHTTPVDYLNRYRLDVARTRLMTTACSVTRVAAECGFSGAAYFDRAFKKQYGESPTACRKRRGALQTRVDL